MTIPMQDLLARVAGPLPLAATGAREPAALATRPARMDAADIENPPRRAGVTTDTAMRRWVLGDRNQSDGPRSVASPAGSRSVRGSP